MKRERVIQDIRKASEIVSGLPSDDRSTAVVARVLRELLAFCEEVTIKIDQAVEDKNPIRADMFLAVLSDIQKDASLVDMLLKLDSSYDEARLSIAEGVETFNAFASKRLSSSILLFPLRSDEIN